MQAVFERLVDIICTKMSETLSTDPSLAGCSRGTKLTGAQASNTNCNC